MHFCQDLRKQGLVKVGSVFEKVGMVMGTAVPSPDGRYKVCVSKEARPGTGSRGAASVIVQGTVTGHKCEALGLGPLTGARLWACQCLQKPTNRHKDEALAFHLLRR